MTKFTVKQNHLHHQSSIGQVVTLSLALSIHCCYGLDLSRGTKMPRDLTTLLMPKTNTDEWFRVGNFRTPFDGSEKYVPPLDPLVQTSVEAIQQTSTNGPQVLPSPEERIKQAAESHENNLFMNIGDAIVSRLDLPTKYVAPVIEDGVCFGSIGCIKELPNIPNFMKKPEFETHFALYTPNGPETGHKLPFVNLLHYQLMEPEFADAQQTEDAKPTRVTAESWKSESAKLTPASLYPFEMSTIAQSGFDSSLNTRILIGGYLSQENHEWILEVIEAWRELEPKSNIIKVSWHKLNGGIYQSAAYNSRIVARQLVILLHYLDQYFNIDLDKFHVVGHSLGAHIAGCVGSEMGGKIARITGLDPAGPIFDSLSPEFRLDKSNAKFVDILHTNAGNLASGALGLSKSIGHIDYYPNGGITQLGCRLEDNLFKNPLKIFACAHRRAHIYFVELIKVATVNGGDLTKMPRAYSFVSNGDNGNSSSVMPEIAALKGLNPSPPVEATGGQENTKVRAMEFHLMHPKVEQNDMGNYLFATLSKAPFLSINKQCLLRIKPAPLEPEKAKKKITLRAKICKNTTVVDVDFDEIPTQTISLLFAMPQEISLLPKGGDGDVSPFNLLWRSGTRERFVRIHHQQQQDILVLESVEVQCLDEGREAAMQIGAIQMMGNMWYNFSSGTNTPQVQSPGEEE